MFQTAFFSYIAKPSLETEIVQYLQAGVLFQVHVYIMRIYLLRYDLLFFRLIFYLFLQCKTHHILHVHVVETQTKYTVSIPSKFGINKTFFYISGTRGSRKD